MKQKLPEIRDCSNCKHNLNLKSIFCLAYQAKLDLIETNKCKRWKWIDKY